MRHGLPFLLALTVATAPACGLLGPDDARHFDELRAYTHDLFETEQACEEAIRSGINCSMIAAFCPDGSAFLVVTDIIHRAGYRIRGSTLIVEPESNPETGTVRFTLSADEDTAVERATGTVWHLDPEEAAFWEDSCASA